MKSDTGRGFVRFGGLAQIPFLSAILQVLTGPLHWLATIDHPDETTRSQAAAFNLIVTVPALGSLLFGLLARGIEPPVLALIIFYPLLLYPVAITLSKRGRMRAACGLFEVLYVAWIGVITLTIQNPTVASLIDLVVALLIPLVAAITFMDTRIVATLGIVNLSAGILVAWLWWPALSLSEPYLPSAPEILTPPFTLHAFTILVAVLFIRMVNLQRARLADQVQLLKVILDNIPVGVAVFDRAGFRPLYKNTLITELAGEFDDAHQGRLTRSLNLFNEAAVQRMADPLQRMSQAKPWEAVGRSGRTYDPDGYVTLTCDGQSWDIQEKAIPIRNAFQEVTQVVYSAVDVSKYRSLLAQMDQFIAEQKSASEDLRVRDRARLQVMAVFGHELRTPINTIISRLEMMLADYAELLPEVVNQDLRTVAGAAQDIRYLADNLLEAANVSAQQQTRNPERFDLRPVVEDIALNMEILIHKKGLRLERVKPSEPVTVYADSRHVRQIVYNLMANAYKYTNEGTITVLIERTFHEARVSIIDTGSGIPADKLDSIFRRFEQLQREGSRRQSGLGLGLAIARSLVMMQGGQLWVESAVNRGSRFSFSLPLAEAEGTRPAIGVDIVEQFRSR